MSMKYVKRELGNTMLKFEKNYLMEIIYNSGSVARELINEETFKIYKSTHSKPEFQRGIKKEIKEINFYKINLGEAIPLHNVNLSKVSIKKLNLD